MSVSVDAPSRAGDPRDAEVGEAGGRVRVLAVCDYYLPGFHGGGPVRTVSTLARLVPGEIEVSVLTRDRDAFSDAPYAGIPADRWTAHDGVPVRYVSPRALSLSGLADAVGGREHDVLYLNSLWSAFTRRILVLRRLGRLPRRPVVVAPRGELSPGALGLNRVRKRAWLVAARAAGLFRGVVWQATNEAERGLIARELGGDATILVAPNPSLPSPAPASVPRPPKRPGELRLVYLARISEMKNLLGALELLLRAEGRITFDVYGTREREEYWERCRRAMAALPPNVACAFHGPVPPERVEETLARYHVFVLPTLGENFGHGVVEAMRAGCPPLISDRTPWRGLAAARAGWDVPLEDADAMRAALRQAVEMDQETWEGWAAGARAFAEANVRPGEAREAYLRLFRRAVEGARER